MAEYKPTLEELARLVGNKSVYAVQKPDGSYYPVRPADKGGIKSPADWGPVLRDHLDGRHTIGTYAIDGDQARTLVFDVDSGDNAKAEIIKLRKTLASEFGVRPEQSAVEFSGNKGFHIWVLLPAYVPANHLRRMGKAVASIAGVDCEVFPKQDTAVDTGSLVKLPGGRHRKTLKANNFLTAFPVPLSKDQYETAVRKLPEEKRFSGSTEEAYPCLTTIQEGVADGGRNNSLFHACVMFRRSGVHPENIWLLAEAINVKFDPPLDAPEFKRTVESALRGGGPICGTLDEDTHCGDLCIVRRERGLYMRPKQLRYAGEGEHVVVQVAKRNGNVVELAHPDLAKSMAKVAEEKE